MTPLQRISLTCRQTGEQASRLLGWLEHDQAYALQHRGLRDEIDVVVGQLAQIRHAVEQPPSIGVVGSQGAGKTDLIAALASQRQHELVAEFSGGQIDLNVIDAVLPPAGHQGIGVVLRFSAIEGPVAPKGLPVRLGLLSQTDLVRIITRAFHIQFAATHRAPPTAARIVEAFGRAERSLSAQAVVGLSARDIVELRDHLHSFYPESPTLRALAAGGYWDQLGELAAHLPDSERRRLLVLLWNEEAGLTNLFGRLCDGLERLGHAADVFVPIEALATKERGTGWVMPHPRSIVVAATQHMLGQGIDDKLRVAGRYGQIVEVERSVLAGLAAELPMRLAAPHLATLKPAQILEFPSPPALVDFDPDISTGADSQLGHMLASRAALFAHIKASYLLERACQRHDITALVVCVDPMAANDDDVSPAVAEWIETTQGCEPHQRERLQTGLFIVGTKLDQLWHSTATTAPLAGTALRDAAQRWGDQLGLKLANDIGVDQEWPAEWTPGRAFHNVYLLQRPATTNPVTANASPGASPDQLLLTHRTASQLIPASSAMAAGLEGDAVLAAPNLVRFINNASQTWSGATVAADGGIAHLMSGLASAVQAAAKHRQLSTHLVDLRRRLRSRLLRLHFSNDPSQIAEWRRQLSIVAQGRLQRLTLTDRLHVLHLGLSVTEHELRVLYAGAEASGRSNVAPPRFAQAGGHPRRDAAECERLAAATVEYWLQSIRQVVRSPRFCRSVGVAQPVLQHIVDEISIGVQRLGLAAQLSETFYRAAQAATDRPLAEPYFARSAVQLIGGYIEHLAQAGDERSARSSGAYGGPGRGRLGHDGLARDSLARAGVDARDGVRDGQHDSLVVANRADGTLTAEARDAATVLPRPLIHDTGRGARDWAAAYGALVEANISAAAHLTGGADRDRELGELLAGFLANPLEVDP